MTDCKKNFELWNDLRGETQWDIVGAERAIKDAQGDLVDKVYVKKFLHNYNRMQWVLLQSVDCNWHHESSVQTRNMINSMNESFLSKTVYFKIGVPRLNKI